MMVFRDMTFCSATLCQTTTCRRHESLVPEQVKLPVAWCDFSKGCEEYDPRSQGVPGTPEARAPHKG